MTVEVTMSNHMSVEEFSKKLSNGGDSGSWFSQLRQLMQRDGVVELKSDDPTPLNLQWAGWG